MQSYTLIKFDKDWADEFDCRSFKVFQGTVEEAVAYVTQRLQQSNGALYFGTNEGWDEGEVTLDDFTFVLLTGTEYLVMTKLFPAGYFGTGFIG